MGELGAKDGEQPVDIGNYCESKWLSLIINTDADRGRFDIAIDGNVVLRDAGFAEAAQSFQRISFRIGPYRGIGGANPVPMELDRPITSAAFMG